MFCLTANGATYSKHSNILYVLNTTGAGERPKNLSDNGVLNSKKVVNKFVGSLGNVAQYQSANINRGGEAAVLNLDSYEVSNLLFCKRLPLKCILIKTVN